MLIGKQSDGSSSDGVKVMALKACHNLIINKDQGSTVLADIGCGGGDFTRQLIEFNKKVIMLDYTPLSELPSDKCSFWQADLNLQWPIQDKTVDFLFALEVIEHIENPRHFFRELYRVIRPGGFGFISTPNNESFFSKCLFSIRNQHRYFQDSCYPKHITPLLHIDFLRILKESNLVFKSFHYTNHEILPIANFHFRGFGKAWSGNYGVLFQKQT